MSVVQITRETVTVTERRVQPDMRHVIIDVLRQQDALNRLTSCNKTTLTRSEHAAVQAHPTDRFGGLFVF